MIIKTQIKEDSIRFHSQKIVPKKF